MYKTNRTNQKVYDAEGTDIGKISAAGTIVTVSSDVVEIEERGRCLRITKPLTGYIPLARLTFTPDPPPPPPPPPPTGELHRYFVQHDIQSPLADPPFRARIPPATTQGAPEVWRIGAFDDHTSHNKVKFNSARQFFWANLISMHKYGRLYSTPNALNAAEKKYIGNKLGALMGHQLVLFNASADGKNHVNGDNAGAADPAMAALICGGNTITGVPAGKNKRGEQMVAVRSWLASDPLPPVTAELLLDSRVLWLTNVYYPSGLVGSFTQLGGLSVPYPLITAEQYYFPAVGLQEYPFSDEPRSQYLPIRDYFP